MQKIHKMPLDKSEIKPITDVLGYAVMDSQKLEYSIAFLMLLVNNELILSSNEQNEKIDNYMLQLSKKTLGLLIRQLQGISTVSQGFIEKLNAALDARNYLIHKFFNDQGENMLTIEGRKEALRIAKEKRKILYDCYNFLDPFIQNLMTLRGMNYENVLNSLSKEYKKG